VAGFSEASGSPSAAADEPRTTQAQVAEAITHGSRLSTTPLACLTNMTLLIISTGSFRLHGLRAVDGVERLALPELVGLPEHVRGVLRHG
jgi:hypothetical protein